MTNDREVKTLGCYLATLAGNIECPRCSHVMRNLGNQECKCENPRCELFNDVFRRPSLIISFVRRGDACCCGAANEGYANCRQCGAALRGPEA